MQNKKHLDQTQAPIYEALQQFRQMRVVPFDVPGHKRGRGNPELAAFLGEQCVSIDVNSMKPLDNLCHPVDYIFLRQCRKRLIVAQNQLRLPKRPD